MELEIKKIQNKLLNKARLEINGTPMFSTFRSREIESGGNGYVYISDALPDIIALVHNMGQEKVDSRDGMAIFGVLCAAYEAGRRGEPIDVTFNSFGNIDRTWVDE
jgi:hypothetical protein